MSDANSLSERELEVLALLSTGASNKEIAQKLFITPNTVKVHLRNIFAKIGVASRTEAALYAVSKGIRTDVPAVDIETSFEAGTGAAHHPGIDKEGEVGAIRPFQGRLAWLWYAASSIFMIGLVAVILISVRNNGENSTPSVSSPADLIRWSVASSMPTARSGLAVAAFENLVYAIGGEGDHGIVGTVEYYEPLTDKWREASSKTVPVTDISAAVIGGKMYIPGGRLENGSVTDLLEIYDPRSDSWTSAERLPEALCAYGLIAFEGKLYLFGGWDGAEYVSGTYEYNPELDRWNKLIDLQSPRGYPGVVSAGDKIYVFGGYDGEGALTANEIFRPTLTDVSSNPWTSGLPLPEGIYAMGVTDIAETLYVLGGFGNTEREFSFLAYFPQTDEWRVVEEPPKKLGGQLGAVSIGSSIYAVGGKVESLPSDQNQIYQAIYTISIPVIVK